MRGQVSGDADHRHRIGSVRGDRQLEDDIGKLDQLGEVDAELGLTVEDQDPGVIVPKPQLALGADHPVGLDAPDGAPADLEVPGQDRPRSGHRHMSPLREVPGTADDLLGPGTDVHLAHPHLVRVGMGGDLLDPPHDHTRPPRLQHLMTFDVVAHHRQGEGQLGRVIRRELDELLEPAQRYFHLNCLRKRRSFSTKCLMSEIPFRTIAMRSTPMPKAKPDRVPAS